MPFNTITEVKAQIPKLVNLLQHVILLDFLRHVWRQKLSNFIPAITCPHSAFKASSDEALLGALPDLWNHRLLRHEVLFL